MTDQIPEVQGLHPRKIDVLLRCLPKSPFRDQLLIEYVLLEDEVKKLRAGLKVIPDYMQMVQELRHQNEQIANVLHYPKCWDDVAYPTLLDAVSEIAHCTVCAEPEAHGVEVKDGER